MLYFTILYFTVLYCTVLQTRFRDLPNSCVCVSTVYSPPPQPDKLRFVKSLWKSPHTAQHTVSTVSGNVCIYWTLAATGTLVGRTVRRQTRQKMTHTLPWSWHFFMNQTWAELFLFSPFVLIIWRKPWGYIWNVKRCMYSVTFFLSLQAHWNDQNLIRWTKPTIDNYSVTVEQLLERRHTVKWSACKTARHGAGALS